MESCSRLCCRKGYEVQMSKLPPVTHTMLWPSLNSVNQSTVDRKAYQYDKQLHLQQKVLNYFYSVSDKFMLVQYCKVHGDMLLLLDWQKYFAFLCLNSQCGSLFPLLTESDKGTLSARVLVWVMR